MERAADNRRAQLGTHMISLNNERLSLLGLEPDVFRGTIANPVRLEWNPPCLLSFIASILTISAPAFSLPNTGCRLYSPRENGSDKPTSFVNGTTQGNLLDFLDRSSALTLGPRAGPVLLTGPIPIESAWVFSRIPSRGITSSH
jgi:hypothetical protein